jgi:hypothetical protein
VSGDEYLDWANTITIDGSGRIVVGGGTDPDAGLVDPDWLLARYLGE